MACINCKFYFHYKDLGFGECRRYPPIVAPEGEEDKFPLVNKCDWCGEFALVTSRVAVGKDYIQKGDE